MKYSLSNLMICQGIVAIGIAGLLMSGSAWPAFVVPVLVEMVFLMLAKRNWQFAVIGATILGTALGAIIISLINWQNGIRDGEGVRLSASVSGMLCCASGIALCAWCTRNRTAIMMAVALLCYLAMFLAVVAPREH